LTNLFIAFIYALGLNKDLCTGGCSTGESGGDPATWLVPTDIAFTAVFRYLGLPENSIFEFTALLYDIVLYHIIPGASILSTDIVTGTTANPILARYTLDNDEYPELEFTRVDSEDAQGWHFTQLFVQGQEFAEPPARVIIPDQVAPDGIVHTINRVLLPSADRTCLTPNLVYLEGDCDDIPCTVTGLFPAVDVISVETVVTYVPDPTCIPWCLSWWCFPCTPLSAQPIVSLGGINGSFTASFADDPLGAYLNILNRGNALGALSLYVNQVGELRLGIAPYFNEALLESNQFLDFTNAPSIYASQFVALPFGTYKILATYSEPCKLAKIYVNDILRATASISFGLSNFDQEFVIIGGSNPNVRVKPGTPPEERFAGVTAQFTLEGYTAPLEPLFVPINPFTGTVNGIPAADYDYTSMIGTLRDGIDGWTRIEGGSLPAYLTESAYFKDCDNPKYHQCLTSSPKDACCGLSARDYREWLGVIRYVYLYDIVVFPSTCTYQDFLPTVTFEPPVQFPAVEEGNLEQQETEEESLTPGAEELFSDPTSDGSVLNPFDPTP